MSEDLLRLPDPKRLARKRPSRHSGRPIPCEKCGLMYRPTNTGHLDSPRCIVERVRREQEARGWVQVHGSWVNAIKFAGFPIEKHPGTVRAHAGAGNRSKLRPEKRETDPDLWGVELRNFTEKRVVEALELLGMTRGGAQPRDLRILAEDEELRRAVWAVRKLVGHSAAVELLEQELIARRGQIGQQVVTSASPSSTSTVPGGH